MKKKEITKRIILSRIAEIWDTLGITAGVLLTGKLLFQSVTRLNFGWDKLIEHQELADAWTNWNQKIEKCKDVLISRSILPSEKYAQENLIGEIIGYSDGSNVGYGSVNYIRWKNLEESKIDVKFLCAKAKVAPIKGNTIPRNELCGALNLARLTWSLVEALKKTDKFKNNSVTDTKLFTDSSTVLSWVNSVAIRYKPYVKNKVIQIQNLIPSSNWRYIPSKENKTADLLSRGCLKGPDIL